MNNKKIIALAVIGAVAILGLFFPKASNSVVKETVREIKESLGGVSDFDSLATNKVVFSIQRLEINRGTTTASWRNDTGEIVFVDFAEIYVPAKASSTMHLFMNVATSS